MADEVKLITFAGETVSPLYDGLMQELYTGGGGIITGAVVTIKDASTLHITGGYGALCGREFEIFASDIPVTLSSSGTLKGRLYLHMDLAQSGSPIELLVEVASSLTPVVQDSDVNTTNGVYEVNLATFDVGTSAISNLVDVSPKLSKIPDQISSLNSALANKITCQTHSDFKMFFPSNWSDIYIEHRHITGVVVPANGDTSKRIAYNIPNIAPSQLPSIIVTPYTDKGVWAYTTCMVSELSQTGCIINVHNFEAASRTISLTIMIVC